MLSAVRCPVYPYRRGFLGFGAIDDYAQDLPPAYAVTAVRECPTEVLLTQGDSNLGVDMHQARNIVSHLMSCAWDRLLQDKGMRP